MMQKERYCHSMEVSVEYPYLVYTPADFQAEERLPMIVFLHGAGERGSDPERMKCHSIPKLFDGPVNYRCVVICPQCPDGQVWNTQVDKVKEFIVCMAEQYHVDREKISLTGVSMGGYGCWELAMNYPELFCALAPVCGDGMPWRAGLLKDLPVWAFHGEADNVVFPEGSKRMIDAINRVGGQAKLTLYPGVGHDCWVKAYAPETGLIEWLLSGGRAVGSIR